MSARTSQVSRRSQRAAIRKKRRRFLILRRLTLTLIILTIILTIAYLAYASIYQGAFNVREIVVENTEILTDEQVIEASGLKIGENIFTIDVNKARYNINQILAAKEILIRKVLPDKIVISIKESDPLGVIVDQDKNYYFDYDGALIEENKSLGNDSIPVVTGFKSYKFSGYGKAIVAEPEYKFEQMLNILKLLKQNGFLGELSQITLTNSNSFRIITKNGIVFVAKDYTNVQEYINYISFVIENGETNQEIILDGANNVIKKAR